MEEATPTDEPADRGPGDGTPDTGLLAADDLARAREVIREWTCAASGLIPRGTWIDAHTHLGLDTDGMHVSRSELEAQLAGAAVQHAIVVPLHHEQGYAEANPEVARWAAESGGRLLPLWRIDPRHEDAAADAAVGFAAGAVGLKLHPRAEQFEMREPGVRAAAQVAAEHHGVILIHAGRGMGPLGEQVVEVAREVPDATFILAHAAISDLSWIIEATRDLPNIVFDTSWWNPLDIAALLVAAPPSRVLFGSDPPYGTVQLGLMITARVARAVGYDDAQMSALFGGNVARLLGGNAPAACAPSDPHTVDAACTFDLPVAPWPLRRAAGYLTGSIAVMVSGGNPAEQLDLAARALEVPARSDLAAVAEPLAEVAALAARGAAAGDRFWPLQLAVFALTHARTAHLGVPPLP